MSSIGWHSYVLRWESESPEAPALVGPNETLTFRQLAWRGRKFAAELARAGVKPGQVVVVRARRDFDFQFTLALSMLGAIGISNTAKQYLEIESETDWLITRKSLTDYPTAKQIVVSEPWIQRAFNSLEPYEIVGLASEDAIERICLSSGTTGRPKAVAFSHRTHHNRMVALEEALDNHGPELYLIDMGAAVGALRAFAPAFYGMPYLHLEDKSAASLASVFSRGKVERLAGSTIQVEGALRVLEQQRVSLDSLKSIRVGGSRVSTSLIAHLKRLPVASLQIGYGSTEAGPSTVKSNVTETSGRVGYPMPGVELQVVDQSGSVLGSGEVGRLRVKTSYSASGYLHGSDAASQAFSEGWFYPGDMARIHTDGELEILSREDDLLNLGGVKVDPNEVEDLARVMLGVNDLAAVQFEDLKGNVNLCIAIVAKERPSTKSFEKEFQARHKVRLPIHFLVLADLPKGDTGKIRRAALVELALARFS